MSILDISKKSLWGNARVISPKQAVKSSDSTFVKNNENYDRNISQKHLKI